MLLVGNYDINHRCQGMLIALSLYSKHYTCYYSVESSVDVPKTSSAKYQKEPQYERMEVLKHNAIYAHVIHAHNVTVGY